MARQAKLWNLVIVSRFTLYAHEAFGFCGLFKFGGANLPASLVLSLLHSHLLQECVRTVDDFPLALLARRRIPTGLVSYENSDVGVGELSTLPLFARTVRDVTDQPRPDIAIQCLRRAAEHLCGLFRGVKHASHKKPSRA